MKKSNPTGAGNILLVTVITLAVLSVFVGLAVEYTNNVGRNVQRSILLRQATNIADASTEMSFSAWRAIARQKGNTVMKNGDMDNELPTPAPINFPGVTSFTLSNYNVYPLNSSWVELKNNADTPTKIAGPNKSDISYYFMASADVIIPTVSSKNPTNPNDEGNIVSKVRRIFQKETLSLWRYAIFFDDDLEMHPGANQIVNGEVHTNGNLYTAHDLLTLNGKTTYANKWEVNFKPGDSRRGSETPTTPKWGIPPANGQSQEPYDVSMPDYHELIESRRVTKTPALDPALAAYRFETQAGVSITIDNNNAIRIYKNGGAEITNASSGSADQKLANAFKNAITTNETITDAREGATNPGRGTVRLATLDVSAITTAMNNGTIDINPQPIVYIIDTSATNGRNANGTINSSAVKRGIRLKKGGKLPIGGLTIASGNPVYVQGDYNTGTTYNPNGTISSQPAANNSNPDPTKPTVTGYTREPSAIIADAVNVLSNAWNDGAPSGTASPTTINTAIISGNVETANGSYSGGVENFPRLHENWTGKALTYYGSMIQLYQSTQSVGLWGPGYQAPSRAWYFDTNFITTPPPGSLVAINYRRSRWFME